MSAVVVSVSPSIARIVVELRGQMPDRVTLDTLFAVARAYRAKIDGLYIEEQGLAALADLACARHVSFAGHCSGASAFAGLANTLSSAIGAVRRDLERRAKADDLQLGFDVVREDPDACLSAHCAKDAIVLLSGGLSVQTAERLAGLLGGTSRIIGALLVGPMARVSSAAIIAVASDLRSLERVVRTALRLQDASPEPIRLVLAGSTREDLAALAAAAERLIPPEAAVTLIPARITPGSTATFVHSLGRIPGRLMILPVGGVLPASAEVIRALANGLNRPLLLLK